VSFSKFHLHTGGERWYVNNVELSYSSSNPIFEHVDRPDLNVKLATPPHTFLFPTPIGKSFECMNEQTILMYAQVCSERNNHGGDNDEKVVKDIFYM
jgi:hypothetical protein